MILDEFQAHVAAHAAFYSGVHRHSHEEFAAFEAALGYAIPETIRWLLGTHGYADATGIGNLAESVEDTLRCRRNIDLPNEWLVLNDWNDAGVVLLNLESERVCRCGAHDVARIASGDKSDNDSDWFPGYPEWCVSRLRAAIQERA